QEERKSSGDSQRKPNILVIWGDDIDHVGYDASRYRKSLQGGFSGWCRIQSRLSCAKDPSYPGINRDYRNTLHFLENLEPDIWGGHHTEYFDLEGKRKPAATEAVNAWIDPEGYRRFIAGKKRAFEDQVDLEMGVKK